MKMKLFFHLKSNFLSHLKLQKQGRKNRIYRKDRVTSVSHPTHPWHTPDLTTLGPNPLSTLFYPETWLYNKVLSHQKTERGYYNRKQAEWDTTRDVAGSWTRTFCSAGKRSTTMLLPQLMWCVDVLFIYAKFCF